MPTLYSFRRCPYALRARFALKLADVTCVMREVDLKAKPKALLSVSPKGTVPVLVFENGDVLDESMDIINWALPTIADDKLTAETQKRMQDLIAHNDVDFVKIIHRYKYPERFANHNFEETKKELFAHLDKLNALLREHQFLLGATMAKADIAIFPFIRQVVQIVPEEFRVPSLKDLLRWLDYFLQHPLLAHVMTKYPVWHEGDAEVLF